MDSRVYYSRCLTVLLVIETYAGEGSILSLLVVGLGHHCLLHVVVVGCFQRRCATEGWMRDSWNTVTEELQSSTVIHLAYSRRY